MHTWLHIIDWRAGSDGGALALDDGRTRLDYRALRGRIDAAAAAWHTRGVRDGDVVAILAHNSADHLVQTLGLARIGALPLLLNWRLSAREVNELLDAAQTVGIFTDDRCLHLVTDRPARVRVLSGATAPGWAAHTVPTAPAAAMPGSFDTDPYGTGALRSDRTAFLMHTSGTTGHPKLIPLDHGSLIRSLAAFALDIGDQQRGSRHLVMMPLFHLAGFAQAMQCFLTGGTLYIHDGFDVDGAIDAIERDRIEFFTAAPALIDALTGAMEGPRAGADLSSLREVQYGSAPIDSSLLERALRVLCSRFRQIYGSTELQGFLTTLRPEDHVPASGRISSAGRPSPGWDVRVVDPLGTALPPGCNGELQARGECLIDGYWRSPEETAAAFTADGWYRTGDLASIDADDFVHIVGRVKDMIVSGGENIYPAEIERVLLAHPAVAEAAVVGAPHPRWGETPVAFFVPAGTAPSTADLTRHCRERLAGFKCPRTFVPVGALPRNTLGKVVKSALREQI
ncbi:class I adenylate-forming enzyme family protein [Tomitella gaofuii]|uniref:class I adenylate-forming enzyme family protein n=1 Tax=Tomitella gaofuii TaxID=2760083 RepID=UPI0015FDDCE4|nr:AMP-binding protein [Tomitella gaofuii]